MNRSVWILTTEYNEYDQYGEYFDYVFFTKPTREDLMGRGVGRWCVDHVLKGGGRIDNEYMWWFLTEYTAKDDCNEAMC